MTFGIKHQGSYRWALAVARYNGTQVLAGGGTVGVVAVQAFRGRAPDYDPKTLQPVKLLGNKMAR